MSLPILPDVTPRITLKREEVIHLLLTSVAMEEITMSHIMNSEGEKIQQLLDKEGISLDDMLRLNQSMERMFRNIISKQILLQFKLDQILELEGKSINKDEGNATEEGSVTEEGNAAEEGSATEEESPIEEGNVTEEESETEEGTVVDDKNIAEDD
ncbi:hypothetical protein [Brevibacillus choshinensis]|uniref:hypothetical protein n=1 Tax=Brevibacillus choshinensis TaxID=54911 RepID=UPI001EED80CA|nr:hypothetical protein [Brevibacillus choshinensis]